MKGVKGILWLIQTLPLPGWKELPLLEAHVTANKVFWCVFRWEDRAVFGCCHCTPPCCGDQLSLAVSP